MKKLLLAILLLISGVVFGQSVTEVIYPRYIQGVGTGNFADDKRVPYVCRMTLNGLAPNATYRFFNRFVASSTITGDEAIDNGQGNIILANTSGPFTRITGPNLGSTINSGSFTTNASGSYTGWFITDPRESQAVFFPGNQIYWRIMLNDGAGGTQVALRLTATNSVTVLKWEFWDPYVGIPPPAGFEGAAITNVTNAAYIPKNLVFLYDNTGASGRPIAGTYIESDDLLNDGTFNSYADFYAADLGGTVDGVDGVWGTIIPAILPSGIRNIRQFSLTNGGAVSECTDADGNWGGLDGNTVDPASRGYFDPVDIECTPTPVVTCNITLSGVVTNILCNSQSNGAVNLTVSGGTPLYTYAWTRTGGGFNATTEDISGLSAGMYKVIVNDAAGCSISDSFNVTQPAQLVVSANAPPIANCGTTTTITISAVGGTAPYTGIGTFSRSAGTYTFTVTDVNGCTASTTVTVTPAVCVTIAEVHYPLYVQGVGSGNPSQDLRVPYACRMTLSGLTAGATYRYFSRFVADPNDVSNGAGNFLLPQAGTWVRVSTASMTTAGGYGEFIASGSGSFTGWFVVEPSSDPIYQPGSSLYFRIILNDGAGGGSPATRITATNSVSVINWGTTAGNALQGSAFWGATNAAFTPKNFVMLYDNTGATGRPVSGTYVESEGLTAGTGFVSWYTINISPNATSTNNRWGTIIPNNNSNGIQNIRQFALGDGSFVSQCTSPTGVWTAANQAGTAGLTTNTVNPNWGSVATFNSTIPRNVSCTPAGTCNLSLSTTQTNVLCFAGSTGAINLTVTGAAGAVGYSWTGPGGFTAATEDIGGLIAGTYAVVVTETANPGCTASTSVTITQSTAITASASAGTIACFGGTTTLTVTASGGTAPLQYSLNGGTFQSGNTFTVNATGSPYTVTVRDANQCTATTNTVTITQPTAITASASAGTIACFGGTTTLTVTASGGTAPLQYSLNGGTFQSGNTFTVNAAGSPYTVTVRDANQCTATTNAVTITQPTTITASASAGIIACFGGTTTLTVTASGGTAPLQYSLNGGTFQSGNTFTINAAGSPYTVTVREANQCTATTNAVTVIQPTVLTATATSTPVTATGGSNGTATANPGGGTPPYTYSWSPGGQTTITATGLTAGTYTVTVTDSRGCTTTATTTVGSPSCNITASASAGTIACVGGTTTLTVTATNGTVPLQYSLNGGTFQSGNTFTVNAAGSPYTVTVRDANQCTATTNAVTITQPTAITASASAGTIACFGGTTTLTATASGGTAPLQYSLNGGAFQSGNTFTVNAAGSPYTVTVRDANQCTATTNAVTVTQPTVLTATATSTPVTTTGGSNGTATANPGGGTPPYTYSWSPGGQTTITATGLTAGTYTVTVTDSRGCSTTATTTVGSPSCNITASASAGTIACFGGTTILTVTASGGTAPLQYSLNGGAFQSGNTFTVNATGSPYTVTVRDGSQCTATTNAVTVTQPTALTATATPVTTTGGSNGTATANPGGGTPPYTYSWSPGGQTTITATGLTAGTYTVTVTDSRGCTTTATTTVGSPSCNITASASTGTIACFGGTTTLTVTATSGTAPLQYSLNGGTFQSGNTFTVNAAGSPYTVTVRDANQCTATTNTVTVTQPTAITASASAGTIACFGGTTTLTVTASGGTGVKQYSLNGGAFQSGNTFIVNAAGSPYTVTVRDANQCTATTNNVTVTQPVALIASSTAPPITTVGGSTTVTVTATGGTVPYTGTGTFTRTAGTYTFTVTDANGCTATTTIILTEQTGCSITLVTMVTNVACNGGSTGAINLSVSGATGTLTYSWSNGATTEDISGLIAGTYTVTVTDANECTATATATVTQPPVLAVTANAGTIPCDGTTTTVTVTATGGTVPYTGTGTFTRTAGTYSFTVTDAKGCTKTVTVTIVLPVPCPAGCTQTSSIKEDFVNKRIHEGDYIWFNSVLDLEERCGNEPIIISITNAKIKYKKNHSWITLDVPDSRITLSNNISWATANFVNRKWEIKSPLRTYDRSVFMAGLSYRVPSGGIPAGTDDVKWTADISINRTGVEIKWKWAAAVYSHFSLNHAALGVKPIDGHSQNQYHNSHNAGTPENFRNRLKAGGTGWGGNNYTGSYSNSRRIKCGECGCDSDDNDTRDLNTEIDLSKTDNTKINAPDQLDVKVTPNPSTAYFNLNIKSGNSVNPISVRILDANGSLLETHQRVAANTILKVGKESWASGIYFAEVVQGDQRKVVRLLRSN